MFTPAEELEAQQNSRSYLERPATKEEVKDFLRDMAKICGIPFDEERGRMVHDTSAQSSRHQVHRDRRSTQRSS